MQPAALKGICRLPLGNRTFTASSLAEAVRHSKTVKALILPASDDLLCRNLMCEHVGDPCICRLSAVLEKLPNLEHLNLSNNNLSALPESLRRLSKLETLDIRGNQLHEVPADLQQQLCSVQVLI
ncbi:hypothetical protein WJX74_007659 [Apatococcus lobatus]|uniref:Uncharacterized protein n=1 Tax=Apatococcus lobatus TaxID=904363 RepID=A0AAW1RFK2_9CHLO